MLCWDIILLEYIKNCAKRFEQKRMRQYFDFKNRRHEKNFVKELVIYRIFVPITYKLPFFFLSKLSVKKTMFEDNILIVDCQQHYRLAAKAERTPSPHDMNRQECRTKRIDSVCAVIWIPLCARDGSVIKWGRGEGETLSIHVVWTQCALGLSTPDNCFLQSSCA